MNQHDYAEGLTTGYGQGTAATAERIRNMLDVCKSMRDVRDIIQKLNDEYELEPTQEDKV